MASQQQSPGGGGNGGGGVGVGGVGGGTNYKRASRKGAPRRFSCNWPGCDKIYSRAEHLQRHQLNRKPRFLYPCGSFPRVIYHANPSPRRSQDHLHVRCARLHANLCEAGSAGASQEASFFLVYPEKSYEQLQHSYQGHGTRHACDAFA